MAETLKASLPALLARLPRPGSAIWPEGEPFIDALRHGSMSVEIFAPRGSDRQTPHEQDELYIIATGSARFEHAGVVAPVQSGDALFVPAGDDHRFHEMSADFVTWVIFWGPQGGERATGDRFTRATAADLPAIIALTEAAYGPYTDLFGYPPLPVTDDYAPRIAAGEVWLLTASGNLAGLLVLELHPDHAMIFSVAVAPGLQGKGYGATLLRHAERLTAEAGLGHLRLYTNARMERNIALYAAFGYQETGRRPNPYRPGWTIVDMAKTLASVAAVREE